jgi:hypothetical protein
MVPPGAGAGFAAMAAGVAVIPVVGAFAAVGVGALAVVSAGIRLARVNRC